MKKHLLFSGLFMGLMFWVGFAFGQCTPNMSVTDPEGNGEMDPDTLEFIAGQPGNINLTIIAPDTATAGSYGFVHLDSIVLKNLLNKPSWMNYACDNPHCKYVAQVKQCALVQGTPPLSWADSIFLIDVVVDAWIHIGPLPVCAAQNVNGGSIVVVVHPEDWGKAEYTNADFRLIQNKPNPFKDKTRIGCISQKDDLITLNVVDMLGNIVYSEKIQTRNGENYFSFTGSELSKGVYFYSVINGQNQTQTRKMVKIE